MALSVAEVALAQRRPVWWVAATDPEVVASQLLGLALELGADPARAEAARVGRADPSDVLWGRLEVHQGWVLVIDNADDLRVLEASGHRVNDGNAWVRGSRAGLVLVTSRNGDMRQWGRAVELHPVGWLTDEEGGQVLLDLAPQAGSQSQAQALSTRLGGLALALHHAGSQLSSPFAQERTFTGYQQAWQDGFHAMVETRHAVDDRMVVTRTWELSLAQLTDAGTPQARPLLEVLAWFAGAVPIPISGLDHRVLGQVCDDRAVGEGLEGLLSVGLLEARLVSYNGVPAKSGDMNAVIVHPLVSETTRHRLSTSNKGAGQSASLAVQTVEAATGELDAERPADWPIWAAWLPHLNELLSHATTLLDRAMLAALAETAVEASRALIWAGAYSAALSLAEDALSSMQRLDSDHIVMLRLRFRVASGHNYLGNHAKAEQQYRAILRTEEQVLGADHPSVLNTRYEVARMVADQGNTAEAEILYRQVLADEERVLGADHPSTLTTRHEVAQMVA
ncbi:tetratricopeptide repeat protein, partial [Actinomadura barringtoniae]